MGKRQYIKIFVNGKFMCDCGGKTCTKILNWIADESFDPVKAPMGLLPRIFDPHYTMDVADELKGYGYFHPQGPGMKYKLTYQHYRHVPLADLESIIFMHIVRSPDGTRRIHHIWAYYYTISALYVRESILPIPPHYVGDRHIYTYEEILQNYKLTKFDPSPDNPDNII